MTDRQTDGGTDGQTDTFRGTGRAYAQHGVAKIGIVIITRPSYLFCQASNSDTILSQASPGCTKITAHPSTVSVPTSYHSMWHYKQAYLRTLNGQTKLWTDVQRIDISRIRRPQIHHKALLSIRPGNGQVRYTHSARVLSSFSLLFTRPQLSP